MYMQNQAEKQESRSGVNGVADSKEQKRAIKSS